MHKAVLADAVLNAVNFHKADLSGAILINSNLVNVGFEGADLKDVDFSQSSMEKVFFAGADLASARNLTQAQLDQACGNEDTQLPPRANPQSMQKRILGIGTGMTCWVSWAIQEQEILGHELIRLYSPFLFECLCRGPGMD